MRDVRVKEPPSIGGTQGRFEPARLIQARARLSLSKADLAAAAVVPAAAIGHYEAGISVPRVEVLGRMAAALELLPEFFNFGRPLARLDTLNPHFRSLRSARVSDRQRALAMAAQLWELIFALERQVKLPKTDLPEVPPGTAPAEAAAILRAHWALPEGPIRHLVATVESHGIVVAMRPLGEIDDVDAFSVIIVDRPIIITTPRRTENVFKHRFSIAHEIGHVLLHGHCGEQSAMIEQEADAFAAAFLTPAGAMEAALPHRLDLAALDRLSRTWGVAPTSLVRRMLERGRTTEASARRARQRLATRYDPTADPTCAYPGEVPSLLRKAAKLAAHHGAPITALADTLKLSPAHVRDLLGEDDQRPALRLVGEA